MLRMGASWIRVLLLLSMLPGGTGKMERTPGGIIGVGTMEVLIAMIGGTGVPTGLEMTDLLLGGGVVRIVSAIAIVMRGGVGMAVLTTTDPHVTIGTHLQGEIRDHLPIVTATIAGGIPVGVDPKVPLIIEGEEVSSAHLHQGAGILIKTSGVMIGEMEMTGRIETLDLGLMIVAMLAGIMITIYK